MLQYTDFIVEQLLMEAKVVYSKKFKNILSAMSDKSKIAADVLSIDMQEKDVAYNYIDVSDNKDAVTFLANKKEVPPRKARIAGGGFYIGTANAKMFARFGFDNPDKEQERIETGTEVEIKDQFPSVRTPGVSLCFVVAPNGQKAIVNYNNLQEIEDNTVWKKNRNAIKVGRLINGLYKVATGQDPSSKDLEDFVNRYKATYDVIQNEFNQFDIVKGKDIRYWYDQKRYESQQGQLGNSCMKHDDFFDIYAGNPDVCSLIILYDSKGSISDKGKYESKKIRGRALLWTLDTPVKGSQYMDRIYTNHDSDIELFKEFAESKGFVFQKNRGMSNGTKFSDMSVKVKPGDYDNYPYMDTFGYYNKKTGTLYSDCDDHKVHYELYNTDGGRSRFGRDDD